MGDFIMLPLLLFYFRVRTGNTAQTLGVNQNLYIECNMYITFSVSS